MAAGSIFSSISDALVKPALIKLQERLYLLQFRIMKIVPAKFIIERALQLGRLRPGDLVLESSSGTFALGLGIVCSENDLRFAIYTDPVIEADLRSHLELLGGEVFVSTRAAPSGGYQKARLDALMERLQSDKSAYWTRQYSNPDNANAYGALVNDLPKELGGSLTIVGTVGSGGSTFGIIDRLRRGIPSAKLVGVDTFNSVLFGQTDGHRLLRGLGNSVLPENVRHAAYDDVHWVSAEAAFIATRRLLKEHAIYAGPTTGAAYLAAKWHVRMHPEETVVTIGPDEGHRYARSVYDNDWMIANGFNPNAEPPEHPALAAHPSLADGKWAWFPWGRRDYSELYPVPRMPS